eukprot:7350436-Ditylum_brightwellii.AAC.1
MAKGQMDFLNEGIASKTIPHPQLLVKCHKDREENGDFPMYLVSDLEEKLEALRQKKDEMTMILLDIKNMYPSV